MNGIYVFNERRQAKTLKRGNLISHKGKFWFIDSVTREGNEILATLCNGAEVERVFFHENEELVITNR